MIQEDELERSQKADSPPMLLEIESPARELPKMAGFAGAILHYFLRLGATMLGLVAPTKNSYALTITLSRYAIACVSLRHLIDEILQHAENHLERIVLLRIVLHQGNMVFVQCYCLRTRVGKNG